MTVSMRVMSAGDGYKYLLKTVAPGDGNRALSTPLTKYYAVVGTPTGRWFGGGFTLPDRWLGCGVASLGDGQIIVGSRVSETQLQLLVGTGSDPPTGEPLGRAYPVYAPVADRIAKRVADLDPSLGIVERAAAVAAIEAEETACARWQPRAPVQPQLTTRRLPHQAPASAWIGTPRWWPEVPRR